ncbi:MAG: hypothetical protein ACRDV8_04795 [Acidimicrobiales bacterium]
MLGNPRSLLATVLATTVSTLRAASIFVAAIVVVAGGGAVAGALSAPAHRGHHPHRTRATAAARRSSDRPTWRARHVLAAGTVTSVGGVTITGHCGTAGKTGAFALTNPRTTKSLGAHVTTATKFIEPRTNPPSSTTATTGASFADVCVGMSVRVSGTVSQGTFTARRVLIEPSGKFLPQSGR